LLFPRTIPSRPPGAMFHQLFCSIAGEGELQYSKRRSKSLAKQITSYTSELNRLAVQLAQTSFGSKHGVQRWHLDS
jgi:hypothetical protein